MKYCYKCGNPMEDDMLFCQKCGTNVSKQSAFNDATLSHDQEIEKNSNVTLNKVTNHNQSQQAKIHTNTFRKSMKIWMLICIALACIYIFVGIALKEMGTSIGAGGFFAVLSAMFFVLAKSPKENPFILNRQSGLKKTVFVLICVVIAFAVIGIIGGTISQGTHNATASTISIDAQGKTDASSNQSEVTLPDVEKWYQNQMPAVAQSLPEYAQSVDGLSDLNVDSSRFFFGGDWNDCYYKFSFTCNINGVNHIGEARAFLKYQDDNVYWFSFEIFSNDNIQSIVELYDDSYDQIIENYYKELKKLYG